MAIDRRPVIVVLAGGRATRMGGGDKALRPLGGATLLDHALGRLEGQSGRIVLNANGDPARFARFGLPVVPDPLPGHPGPLAGVLAGMEWMLAQGDHAGDLVSVPADCPFLPNDLVERLLAARQETCACLACAASANRLHPVAALWPARLAPALRHALAQERLYRVGRWMARFALATAEFAARPVDPFLNINTPDDLAAAEALIARGPPPGAPGGD